MALVCFMLLLFIGIYMPYLFWIQVCITPTIWHFYSKIWDEITSLLWHKFPFCKIWKNAAYWPIKSQRKSDYLFGTCNVRRRSGFILNFFKWLNRSFLNWHGDIHIASPRQRLCALPGSACRLCYSLLRCIIFLTCQFNLTVLTDWCLVQ